MTTQTAFLLVTRGALVLCAAACATTAPARPGERPAKGASALEASIDSSSSVVSSAPVEAGASPKTTQSAPRNADEALRAVFASPRFGRRLAESYLAVTDVEPRVTTLEHEQIIAIFDDIMAERYDAALKLIDKHGKGEAASALFDFARANVYFQQDRTADAIASYRTAIDKFPRFLRAWQGLGRIHVREGDYASAADALVKVLEYGGGEALNYGFLGIAHLNNGDYLAAESAFRMAALMDPKTVEWRMYLADSFFKQERFPEAIALLGSLIEEMPDRHELWLLQASAYIRIGQPMSAAENYELVAHLGGSTVESLGNLGDIYVNAELYGPGVDAHLRAIALDRSAVARALTAGKLLTRRGALADVKTLLDGLGAGADAELGPEERQDVLKLRAMIAVAEGAGEEQARVLAEIVELDPLDGEALILLGRHAGSNGEPEKAVFLLERAANVDGFEAEAKKAHGELLVNQGKYAEGLAYLRRAQELKPRDYLQDYIDKVERIAQNR